MSKLNDRFDTTTPSTINKGSGIPEYFTETKRALTERLALEHYPLPCDAGTDDSGNYGRHRPGGCAVTLVSPTAPTSPRIGSVWYDTVAESLKIYSGSTWLGGYVGAGKGLKHAGCFCSSVTSLNGQLYFKVGVAPQYTTDSDIFITNGCRFFAKFTGVYQISFNFIVQYLHIGNYAVVDPEPLVTGDLTTITITIYDSVGTVVSSSPIAVASANYQEAGDTSITWSGVTALEVDGVWTYTPYDATVANGEFIKGQLTSSLPFVMDAGQSCILSISNVGSGLTTQQGFTFVRPNDIGTTWVNFGLIRTY